MNKVKIIISAFVFSLIFTITAFATDVYIDGERVMYDDNTGYPFTENGTVLVPLYPTMQAFGNDGIIQDNPRGAVVITKGDISVSCNTSDSGFSRNGTKINSPYGLVWRGGPLFVPADIFSAFDAQVYIGGSGVVITRPEKEESAISIYGASYDEAYRGSLFFGAKYEPKNGIYLGCVSENDFACGAERFSDAVGKRAAAFTIFADINLSAATHEAELRYAAENGKLVRYVLYGCDAAGSIDNEALIKYAQALENSGARILLCPGYRSTCTISENHESDYSDYIQNFRFIADIFRVHAPSVATVWQICTCNSEQASLYYPGDLYADYVEISMCSKDRVDNIQSLISAYGYKKPLILEACIDIGKDMEDSAKKLSEFFAYLPVTCPQIKALFLPDVSDNASAGIQTDLLNVVRTGLSNACYLSGPEDVKSGLPYYFELCNNVTVPPSSIRLYSRGKNEKSEISRVVYELDGRPLTNTSINAVPFEAEIDFSAYGGKTVGLRAIAYDSSDIPFADKTYIINVSSKQSADNSVDENGGDIHPAVILVILISGIFAAAILIKKINDIFC